MDARLPTATITWVSMRNLKCVCVLAFRSEVNISMFTRPVVLTSLLIGPVVSLEAYCEVYMSEQQATAVLFPGLKFEKSVLPLSAEDQKKIKELSGENVRADTATVWRAASGEWVI